MRKSLLPEKILRKNSLIIQNSEILFVETSNINENAAKIRFLSLLSLEIWPPSDTPWGIENAQN